VSGRLLLEARLAQAVEQVVHIFSMLVIPICAA
jgi:hypothetical protein